MRCYRLILFAACFLVSVSCAAADEFPQYVADMQRLERQQAQEPADVIRYDDSGNGKLLRAVLEPVRAISMLEIYTDRQMNGEIVANLPSMLLPIVNRYDKAFLAAPARYEAEYLDSIEDAAAMQLFAKKSLQEAERKLATPDPNSPDNPNAGRVASTLAMMRSLENLAASGNTLLASSIRQKVARKMLSRDGARRALHVADSLESPLATGKRAVPVK